MKSTPINSLMAWDPKGSRICVVYTEEGRLKLFVYDIVTRIKFPKLDLTDKFGQIQDMKYMLNSNTLLLSAVKNGHIDIFTFDLTKEKTTQITNDIYDDLDAEFVSFP
jgi:Tol biopolymer transport system component